MQEEVDEKTVALAVSATKMTAQALKNSLEKFLQRVDERNRIHVNETRELDLEKRRPGRQQKKPPASRKRHKRRDPTVPGKRA